jgi:hypothetical protein
MSTACPAPGASLPHPDPAAWWLAPPGGPPPRAPSTARAPGDLAAWCLALLSGSPRASATMCPTPRGDLPPPRATAMTCSARTPAHLGAPLLLQMR